MRGKNGGAPVDRLAVSFKQLSTAANYLNNVSDALGEAVTSIESKLDDLNVGITVWTKFADAVDEQSGSKTVFELGYAEPPHSCRSICIRSLTETPGEVNYLETIKPFNDSSRELRLQSIAKLPDLIERLRQAVEAKAAEIKPVVDRANEFARALTLAVVADEEAVD